ncbi:Ubiquitin carboxyl-terminal hydrolase 36 [Frankliniella fusca]|uniref:Ubiquitin carboxyl-terminal hydrolase 36 n=1 Tax=Frankliniella fusca TaxID=407009 RepID=A0AAE1LPM9_9NEOP|nr:Ubiquitin carboxyl-terminal hydrolase 36 [Frankliniella fusca]KAK3927423.1 Ubiquitin carboxyl-terminal hydrolase 36 [Frankliniella fusca]
MEDSTLKKKRRKTGPEHNKTAIVLKSSSALVQSQLRTIAVLLDLKQGQKDRNTVQADLQVNLIKHSINAPQKASEHYRLVGIVHHKGEYLSQGHYTATVANEDGYFLLDDDRKVEEVPVQCVQYSQDICFALYEEGVVRHDNKEQNVSDDEFCIGGSGTDPSSEADISFSMKKRNVEPNSTRSGYVKGVEDGAESEEDVTSDEDFKSKNNKGRVKTKQIIKSRADRNRQKYATTDYEDRIFGTYMIIASDFEKLFDYETNTFKNRGLKNAFGLHVKQQISRMTTCQLNLSGGIVLKNTKQGRKIHGYLECMKGICSMKYAWSTILEKGVDICAAVKGTGKQKS